ncbi:MAG: DUF4321 domain-containing protein [Candidatus Zixiibacteriota bacterium]
MKTSEITFVAVVLILAAVIGGLIGDIVGSFLPVGAVKTLFEKSIDIGLRPFTWELYTISLTFGLMIKINFVSILMIILVIAYFKWWHL